MPAARQRSRSPCSACAVIAMIGSAPAAALARRGSPASPRSRPSPASGSPSGRRRRRVRPSSVDRLAAVAGDVDRGSRGCSSMRERHLLVDHVVLGDQDARPRRAAASAGAPARSACGGAGAAAARAEHARPGSRAAAPGVTGLVRQRRRCRRRAAAAGSPRWPSEVSIDEPRRARARLGLRIARASSQPVHARHLHVEDRQVERRAVGRAARAARSSALRAVAGVAVACPSARELLPRGSARLVALSSTTRTRSAAERRRGGAPARGARPAREAAR